MNPAEETDEEFEAFLNAIDKALIEIYGFNHQEILSKGKLVNSFKWGADDEQKLS